MSPFYLWFICFRQHLWGNSAGREQARQGIGLGSQFRSKGKGAGRNSKQKEFHGKRKESIRCYCSRDILAVPPQLLGVSPVLLQSLLLVSCLDLLVRALGWLSCSAVYKQLCIAKFSRIYNVTAPCESPELGTDLTDLTA